MPTKGPSLRYGNTNGAHHRGDATKNINYAWAKDFNRGGLVKHFKDHGKEFDAETKEEYAAKAIHFANQIDRKNYRSVVDYKKTTYKYNPYNGELVIVSKDGYIISYYRIDKKFTYQQKKEKEVTIWIKI